MTLALHLGAALVGLLLILAFLRSVLQVAVLNRQLGDWLARRVGWLIYTTLARLALSRRSYVGVQEVLAWVLPVYILSLIAVWFCLVDVGFSLVIWSVQAEHSFLQATIASGSALSTLGFLTPASIAGKSLAILEGAMGLGVVVFYFTFLPGYQTTIQFREIKVAWLYARATPDSPPFALIEWLAHSGVEDWNSLWGDWETWFRNLAETHSVAPALAFVPTIHRGQTWLFAAAAVLDSLSFYLSVFEARGTLSATVCRRTGVDALRLLAAELAADRLGPLEPAGRRRLARADFDAACDRLTAFGADVKAERDACWLCFVELRKEYESTLSDLARTLLVPMSEAPPCFSACAPETPVKAHGSGSTDDGAL